MPPTDSNDSAAHASDHGREDAAHLAPQLIGAVFGSLLLAVAILAGVLLLANRAEWWHGLAAAGTASALAAAASLPPLLLGLRRGLYATVAGYFASAGARAAISVGGCLLAIKSGGYPAAPTLLLMVPMYFAVLAAETAVVARGTWNLRG